MKAWTELKVDNYTASVDFMGSAPPYRTDASPALGSGRPILSPELPADQAFRLRKSQTLRIASTGIFDQSLAIGNIDPLFEALDKCLERGR